MRWDCHMCGREIEALIDPSGLEDVVEHLREFHPEEFAEEGPERWPDGSLAVHERPMDIATMLEMGRKDDEP